MNESLWKNAWFFNTKVSGIEMEGEHVIKKRKNYNITYETTNRLQLWNY